MAENTFFGHHHDRIRIVRSRQQATTATTRAKRLPTHRYSSYLQPIQKVEQKRFVLSLEPRDSNHQFCPLRDPVGKDGRRFSTPWTTTPLPSFLKSSSSASVSPCVDGGDWRAASAPSLGYRRQDLTLLIPHTPTLTLTPTPTPLLRRAPAPFMPWE